MIGRKLTPPSKVPKPKGNKKRQQVMIWLPHETVVETNRLALKQGVSRSELVCKALGSLLAIESLKVVETEPPR